MIALSSSAILEKNYIFSTKVWLTLLTLTNRSKTISYQICNNNVDVTHESNLYYAFQFQVDNIDESSQGEIPTINITLSNANRIIGGYIDQDDDLGSGWSVHVDLVLANTNGVEECVRKFDYVSTTAVISEETVVLSCGLRNPIRASFPRLRMLPNTCPHRFKGVVCRYTGEDTSCLKTIEDCRAKFYGASKIPFGGFPSLPGSSLYQ